jgi:HCOMODA/2-hydroxy-3-carboxy-muconic semialdehyde decarboxylase
MSPKPQIVIALLMCAIGMVFSQSQRAGAQQAAPTAIPKAQLMQDLVYGNRILYNEGVLDAFGHISVRDPQNPSHFYLSRSLAPAQVTAADVLEYDLDCNLFSATRAAEYGERFIHCAIYRARPDVTSVIHAHSLSLIPFGVTNTKLRPIFHMGGFLGTDVPIFDIRLAAGASNMMVTSNELGDALARSLGQHAVVLMRGHGQAVVGNSIQQAVVRAYYAEVNARLQAEASKMGTITFLSPEEASKAAASIPIERAWSMFKARVGKIE